MVQQRFSMLTFDAKGKSNSGLSNSQKHTLMHRSASCAMRDFAPHQSFPCVKGALGAAAPLQNVKNPPFDQTSKGGSAVL